MNRRTIAAVGLMCLAVPFYQAQEKPSEPWTAKRNRYRHAATHGRPEAQYRLGILYRDATPGPPNRSRFRILAHAWLSHAVRTVQRSGHLRVAYASRLPTYISDRDTLEANMQPLEVDEAPQAVRTSPTRNQIQLPPWLNGEPSMNSNSTPSKGSPAQPSGLLRPTPTAISARPETLSRPMHGQRLQSSSDPPPPTPASFCTDSLRKCQPPISARPESWPNASRLAAPPDLNNSA